MRDWVRGLEEVNNQIGVRKRGRKDATDLNYTTPARLRKMFSQGRPNFSVDWRDEARTMDGWMDAQEEGPKGVDSRQG